MALPSFSAGFYAVTQRLEERRGRGAHAAPTNYPRVYLNKKQNYRLLRWRKLFVFCCCCFWWGGSQTFNVAKTISTQTLKQKNLYGGAWRTGFI
jgi:hypothetical protein